MNFKKSLLRRHERHHLHARRDGDGDDDADNDDDNDDNNDDNDDDNDVMMPTALYARRLIITWASVIPPLN